MDIKTIKGMSTQDLEKESFYLRRYLDAIIKEIIFRLYREEYKKELET